MKPEEQIEISLSKLKMAFILIGSIVFIGLGFWFIISPPKIDHFIFGNTSILLIIGLASVIFFGIISIVLVRKIKDNKPGLIINEEGIMDNSSGVSAGQILWKDVSEIKVVEVMNQKFIMVYVRNPEDYIKRITNVLKRKTMELNYKSYGSPISISANSLETSLDSLYKLLVQKLKENRYSDSTSR